MFICPGFVLGVALLLGERAGGDVLDLLQEAVGTVAVDDALAGAAGMLRQPAWLRKFYLTPHSRCLPFSLLLHRAQVVL